MKEKITAPISVKMLPHFPTVLVGTGKGEKSNLITVALIHVFSFDPPYLGIGIAPERHSFKLLNEHPEFTVNVPTEKQLEFVKGCGKVSGRDVDKFDKFSLSKELINKISTPGVEECPLTYFCRVVDTIETGDHHWFIGKVLGASKKEDYVREKAVLYWGGEFRTPGDEIKD